MKSSVSALALLFALAACTTIPAPAEEVAPPAATETAPAAATPATEPAATETAVDPAAESARLNAWFDEKYEEELMMNPIQLTFLGRKERYGELGDFSFAEADRQLAWKAASIEEMKQQFDYDALTDDAKTSWDLWIYQYEQDLAGVPFRYNGFTFDQMNGAQSFIPTFLINFHRVDTVADMQAYVSRIEAVGPAMRQLLDVAREASARGIVTPDFALEGVIEQSRKVITGAPFTEGEDSDLMADARREAQGLVEAGLASAEEADALLAAAEVAMLGEFKPVYEEIIAWAESETGMAAANPSGVGSQPNGDAFYNHRISTQTTTDMTADEIHEIGLAEVARIQEEMLAIKDAVGFEGDLKAFFTELREDKDNPLYYYPNTDEGRQAYIADATAAIEQIKAQLPNYFGILPKADLVVKRVEPFREQDGAAQHYYPGTPDGSRPGIYYAHLSDMTAMPKRELEVIAYHEGLPGHHMQISIAQELTEVPQFRTQASFTVYAEGWGLYSEALASEMPGTFEDPYSKFGRLGSEIWRAIRLVVDTGLHSKGWTEQQAVDYFLENAAITEAQARSEVQRYIVMPGQALAYKIGMLKIQALRAKAEAALGDRFDIRAFHDTVLGGGAMPLALLERRVDEWIAEVQAS